MTTCTKDKHKRVSSGERHSAYDDNNARYIMAPIVGSMANTSSRGLGLQRVVRLAKQFKKGFHGILPRLVGLC